ncbi:MAG: ATP-binding region ATPase domain protein [Gemmatimonadetes bacterium]|nr:ATP-binding region ATPase domain protein [Gemmatimonadota bacterium]
MLGSVAVAMTLTLALQPYITRAVYVFLYGAVAVSATYAGIGGGAAAALLSVLLVDYFMFAPMHSLGLKGAEDVISALAFLAGSALLTALAASSRSARGDAEAIAVTLQDQAIELESQQEEAQAIAEELEQSNVELETAMEDAKNARDAAVASEERLRLVDDASKVLASSLDYEATVASVAQLAVPKFADWCAVDLLVDGEIRQLALAHVDPEKVKWARELNARYPVSADDPTGAPAVIRSGEPVLLSDVTDDMLVAGARDAEHLKILREVGIYSVVTVPIAARGETLGALTLVSSRRNVHYDNAALALAMDLGRRAGVAIDNARLHRAAVMANESKANFLATMSHELRTPLTAIIGYEELLAEGIAGDINDTQRQQLGRIKVSAGHLLALIDEILLFARVEAGRESVRLERTVAKGVVDDAVAFVAPLARDRDIALTAAAIDPALMLRTDTGKLRQMLLNLLSNAVKFTVSGSVTVRAFVKGNDVVFEVEDTGIGIAPENLEHVFDAFWQVEQNTTRKVGGSGLGLSVTRRLAELLGGQVTVTSIPRVGTTFRIVLPKEPAS